MSTHLYKYSYEGKDRYLRYFAQYPCCNWSFEEFQTHINSTNLHDSKKKSLLGAYLNALRNIKANTTTPDEVKSYVNSLIDKVTGDKESQQSPTVNNYSFMASESSNIYAYNSNSTIIEENKSTKGKEVSLSSTSTSQPSDPLNQTIESSSVKVIRKSSQTKSNQTKASTRQNDDTQFAREFDLAVTLDLDTVMRYFDGNRYMTEFIEKYQSMDKTYMYKLSDGSYLEERLFKFGLTCTYEHLCHSFIFDPNDVTYIQKKVLTEEQIQELKSESPIHFPDVDDESVNYLMKFAHVTTTEDLRVALYQNGDYNMNYNKEHHQIKDWIRRSLDHLLLVYESTDDFHIEHSEQWYQSRIWLPLELLFERINGSKSLRGESAFASSSERKNLQRAVASTVKLQNKKMGTRVDMLVTVNNLEFLCEEDKASDDSTKMIEERHFKIGKEMKDILWGLFRRCNYDRTKMRKLVSFGITTFKFKAFFDICDFRLGYVARITRSSEYQVPSNISELSNLLPMLSMMLVFRLMIMTNVNIITEAPPEADVRSSLKRPHSPKQEDEFVRAVKKNVSATTPDDAANSRFKSLFKQGQDKK